MNRCYFVKPEVARYDVLDGQWIEFKKHLTAGETKELAGAGVPSMTPGEKGPRSFDLDFRALGLARVEIYTVAWSLADAKGNQTTPTRDTIAQLEPDAFDAIDKLLDEHVKKMADEKKGLTSASAGATS